MTTSVREAVERVLVEQFRDELESLSDSTAHAFCLFCYPNAQLGDVIEAFCGRQRIMRQRLPNNSHDCAECEAVRHCCPKCGA